MYKVYAKDTLLMIAQVETSDIKITDISRMM